MSISAPVPRQLVGRYAVYGKISSGGMATVSLGRLLGSVGFSRIVAIKRLHPHFSEDASFVTMFGDEARLAARIRHPNVVPTLDVVTAEDELFLVMEYVHGETLARLWRAMIANDRRIPVPVVLAIFSGVLHGLHAAHEAKDERGEPLGIVHRDISPQNVMIGVDGVPRVLDFGVAKAAGRLQTTRDGQLKGKLPYMAPEQLEDAPATRQSDVYATAVVLWEALTGRRLFDAESEATIFKMVLQGEAPPPSQIVPSLPAALDAILARALARNPDDRFATAREMAAALEQLPMAIPRVVGAWVEETASESLTRLSARLVEIEADLGDEGRSIAADDPDGAATDVGPPVQDDAAAGPSQISSIAVSSATLRTPARDRRVVRLGAAALVLGLGITGLIVRARPQAPLAAVQASAGSAPVPAVPASADSAGASPSAVASSGAMKAAPVAPPTASVPTPRASAPPRPAPPLPRRASPPKHKGEVIFTDPG